VPSFVCIADTVAKFRARQLGRNPHIVAWSAKLLSLNAEIVSRLNSVMLADRRLKCTPYQETGCEKSKSALGIGTGSSFSCHFGEKPKIGGFLSPVLPLPLAMQGRYWGPSLDFGPLDATCCGKTARCHVVQTDRATSRRAEGPRDDTAC